MTGALLAAVVLAPLLGAGITAILPRWLTQAAGLVASVVVAVLVGGLAWAVQRDGPVVDAMAGWPAPLGIEVRADELSVAFLGLTTVVGLVVACYATGTSSAHGGPRFWSLWLALWSALNAIYVAGDLFNTYVALEIMGVAAVSLVALGGASTFAPALRYLFVTVFGSLAYLVGVALIYGETGTLDIVLAGSELQPGPTAAVALSVMTLGLVLKTALFPLHTWLPGAHANAPAAVSAILSALVVKASLYVLIRLWFTVFGEITAPLDLLLGLLGAVAVVCGSVLALRQYQVKSVVAYSTVAQVGYLFLVFPLVTPGSDHVAASGPEDAAVVAGWTGGIGLLLAHGIAKAAMFLAAGNLAQSYGSGTLSSFTGAMARRPMTVAAFAIAGVSLAGLPPTFGFIGKWQLLQASLGTGQWWWTVILLVGGLLTFAYTARVVRATFDPDGRDDLPEPRPLPRRMEVTALSLAALAVVLGFGSLPILSFLERGVPFGGGA